MTSQEKETILTGLELLTDEQLHDFVFCLKTIRESPEQRDELLAVCGWCWGKNMRIKQKNSVTQGG